MTRDQILVERLVGGIARLTTLQCAPVLGRIRQVVDSDDGAHTRLRDIVLAIADALPSEEA